MTFQWEISCSWKACRPGQKQGSQQHCLLWCFALWLLQAPGLGVSSQPVLLCHSLPAFSSHLTPSKGAKGVTPSLFQLQKPFFLKEDVSSVGHSCGTQLFVVSISLASLFLESHSWHEIPSLCLLPPPPPLTPWMHSTWQPRLNPLPV